MPFEPPEGNNGTWPADGRTWRSWCCWPGRLPPAGWPSPSARDGTGGSPWPTGWAGWPCCCWRPGSPSSPGAGSAGTVPAEGCQSPWLPWWGWRSPPVSATPPGCCVRWPASRRSRSTWGRRLRLCLWRSPTWPLAGCVLAVPTCRAGFSFARRRWPPGRPRSTARWRGPPSWRGSRDGTGGSPARTRWARVGPRPCRSPNG
jgi:hypothetical protein